MLHYQMIQVAFKKTMHFNWRQNTHPRKHFLKIQEPHNKETGIGNVGTKPSFCAEFEMRSKALLLQVPFRLHSYFPNLNTPSLTKVQDCMYLRVQGFTFFFQLLLPIHRNITEDFEIPLKKLVVPLRELERLNYEKKRKLREFQYFKSRQQGKSSAVTLRIPAPLELGVDKIHIVHIGSK